MIVFISFITTFFCIYALIKFPNLRFAIDLPNSRSLHTNPVPRTGGLGLLIGAIAAWVFGSINYYLIVLCIILCVVSLLDDICNLSVVIRFITHALVAILFGLFLLKLTTNLHLIFIIFILVWSVNLYNFMDGSDGLAGGMALFGFSSYALAAYLGHDLNLALLSASLASSSLAFLCFNFNPAKIFMGDAGSITLGFLVAAIGLLGIESSLWEWWFPILVFSPFIVDATVTILKRLIKGEKIWQAHKSHYYQRLIQMGWTHRKTAIVEYFLMFSVGCTALLLIDCSTSVQLVVLCCWFLILIILMMVIDKKWQIFQKHKTI